MIFSEVEQKRLVAAYIQAWVSEAQKVEGLTASINLGGIRDYEDSDAEESRLHAEYKLITDIRDAKKAAVSAGVDEYGNELHAVVNTPGFQRNSDAAAAFRDAVDKLRDLGKARTQEAGRAELAAMPGDAPIEDRATAIFRKYGYRPAPARLRETIDHIKGRTALGYLRDVIGNPDNKATREIFSVITGRKLPSTRRDSLVVLDEWFGITPEQRAQMDAEKETARLEKLALDDLLSAWNVLKQLNVRLDGGRVVDGQVYVQGKFVEGFTEATRHKQGASYQYCLSAGSHSNYVKNSKLNAFLKQAIEFGGLRVALEEVWPDIPTEKAVETEESDPEIDALFGAVEFDVAEDSRYYYVYGEFGMRHDGSFTKEKQDWMAFTRDEALPMLSKNTMPYGATKRGVFIGAGTGVRLKLPAKPVTPQVPAGDMEKYIKVTADSIGALRKGDVYRVLIESNMAEFRCAIARYIKEKRSDLIDEVDSVLAEAEDDEVRKKARPSMRG